MSETTSPLKKIPKLFNGILELLNSKKYYQTKEDDVFSYKNGVYFFNTSCESKKIEFEDMKNIMEQQLSTIFPEPSTIKKQLGNRVVNKNIFEQDVIKHLKFEHISNVENYKLIDKVAVCFDDAYLYLNNKNHDHVNLRMFSTETNKEYIILDYIVFLINIKTAVDWGFE